MAVAVPFPREAVGMKEFRDGSPILWSAAAFDISSHQTPKAQENWGDELKTDNMPTTTTTHHSLPSSLSWMFSFLAVGGKIYFFNWPATINIGWINCTCSTISAPPRPFLHSFSSKWMAWMLYCAYRDNIGNWCELNSSSLVSCCVPSSAEALLILSDSGRFHKDLIAADTLWSQSHFSYSLAGWSSRTCQIRSPQCISACVGP